MEVFGYYCRDEDVLLLAVLTFIWLHFIWETYLKYRQVYSITVTSVLSSDSKYL